MSDSELFLSTLRKIRDTLIEERSEISGDDEINAAIAEDYDNSIEVLERVIPDVKEIDDVWSLEESDFITVLTCFENYMDVFIIDGTDEKKLHQDEAEYEQLEGILAQFYEDDDEFEDDEDSEE